MRATTLATALLTLALSGCQSKLKFSESMMVGVGETKYFVVDGPRHQQTVAIEVTSAESEISVFVCLNKDREQVDQALQMHKLPSGTLGSLDKTKAGTITATIPAGEKFCVFLDKAIRNTNVTVKIAGQ